jgi:protein TonB
MPVFPGGEAALLKYIAQHTNYPAVAKEKNIQGKVIISFVVNEDCKISNAKVAGGSGMGSPELCAEALRVINSLPNFEKPGLKNGKPVAVSYNVPLTFALK